jgi:hypothetical protein
MGMRMVLILIIVVKKKMSFEGWREVVLEEETQNSVAVHVLLIVGQSSA